MSDPALSMTLDDLRFVAGIDEQLDVAARNAEHLELWRAVRPCPGCVDRCGQCGDDALD